MNPIIDPTTMFRKDVFYEMGGYSNDYHLVADMDLWFKSLLNGKQIYNFQEKLIKYRINSDGNTNKYKKEMIKQHVTVRRRFVERYKDF